MRMIQSALEAGLRQTMRRLVRPLLNPRISLPVQRVLIRQAYHTSRPPRGSQFEAFKCGGVPARRVTCNRTGKGVLLYFHGGGYILGSPETHRGLTGHLAQATGNTVIVPDYRLAPEHPWPAALDDALAAYQALLDDGHRAGDIAVAGDSAGGGLTLALAMRLRDLELPLPACLTVFSPWTDLSNSQLAEPDCEPVLTKAWIDKAARHYAGDTPFDEPLLSPVYGDLKGLPPLLIQAGSQEILLNDAVRLAERAREHDVHTVFEIYNELWHVFQVHAGQLERATEAIRAAASHITGRQS
ncbi:alpha/beta hydrolase [Marinobacter sp.]|uniref:alpha/beta hydrolase n=1 Tax=Marinobacter sp. TaxID=50741 RepID=UPI00384E6767